MSSTDPSERPPELLPLGELSRRLGISPSVMSNWKNRYSDEFPGRAGGTAGRPLYDMGPMLEWIRSNPKRAALIVDPDQESNQVVADPALAAALRADMLNVIPTRDSVDVIALACVVLAELRADGHREPVTSSEIEDALAKLSRSNEVLRAMLVRLRDAAKRPLADVINALCVRLGAEHDLGSVLDRIIDLDLDQRRMPEEHRSNDSDVLVAIVDAVTPTALSTAIDLACGFGTVLSRTAEKHQIGRAHVIDLDERATQLASVRLRFRGVPVVATAADALETTWNERHELVLVEPPRGARPSSEIFKSTGARYPWGPVSRGSADLAWVQTAALLTAPDGVAVVTTSGAALNEMGTAATRRALIADGTVRAIITVPTLHRRSGAVADLAIWLLGPGASTCRLTADEVLFGHADTVQEVDGLIAQFRAAWHGAALQPTEQGLVRVSRAAVLDGEAVLYPWRWVGRVMGPQPEGAHPLADAVAAAGAGCSALAAEERISLPPAPIGVHTVRALLKRGDLEWAMPTPRAELLASASSFTERSPSTTLGLVSLKAGDIVLEVVDDRITGAVQLADAMPGDYLAKSSSRAILRLTQRGRARWLAKYLLLSLTAPRTAHMLGARDARGVRTLEVADLEVAERTLEDQRLLLERMDRLQQHAHVALDELAAVHDLV
jgi:hypothetical protein